MKPCVVMRLEDRLYAGPLSDSGIWKEEYVGSEQEIPDHLETAIVMVDAALCNVRNYLQVAEGVGMRMYIKDAWHYYLPEVWYEACADTGH